MLYRLKTFLKSDSGAVTVDWVVLCALMVAMAAAIASQMQTGSTGAADSVATYMGTLR